VEGCTDVVVDGPLAATWLALWGERLAATATGTRARTTTGATKAARRRRRRADPRRWTASRTSSRLRDPGNSGNDKTAHLLLAQPVAKGVHPAVDVGLDCS